MFKLKLSSRGLLVVIVPFLFQFVFVGWLAAQLWQIQNQVSQSTHSLELTSDLHQLVWQTFKSVFQMHSNSDVEGLVDSDTTRLERARFENHIGRLAAQKWEPDQQEQIVKLQKTAKEMMQCLSWVEQEQSKGRSHWVKVDQLCYEKVCEQNLNFAAAARSVILAEEARISNGPEQIQKLRSGIQKAILVAVPTGFLLSIFLGFLYVIGILRPLLLLKENSRLLSQRQPLLRTNAGPEELDQLNRLLYSVSRSIEETLAKEKSVLNNANALICSLDEDRLFVTANSYASRILGVEADDLLGLSMFDFVNVDDVTRADEALRKCRLTSNTTSFELRLKNVNDNVDGVNSNVDTRWSVFWSHYLGQFFCVVYDITEQKQIERMKEDFLNMTSHDLRSPLMSIHGSLTLISQGAKGPIAGGVKVDIDKAITNLERLMLLVDDLLDFQRLQSGKLELEMVDFDLSSLFSEAIALVDANAKAKGVDIRFPQRQWTVRGDKQRLLQTFLNLLNNAIKFSPANEPVTIAVIEQAKWLEVTITDCGPGVPEDYRERIFNAFEQVPGAKAKEGTGLGLAICKLIIRGHSGQIGVRDRSTFWFSLPKF